MGIHINVSRRVMLAIIGVIFLTTTIFGIHKNKIINTWLSSAGSYTDYVFDATNSMRECVSNEDIVKKANEILNGEELNETISFFEDSMDKKLTDGISQVNGFFYQYTNNFKEGLKEVATGNITEGFKDIHTALQNINDTIMLSNETVEKINNKSNYNNNSNFEFSIGL